MGEAWTAGCEGPELQGQGSPAADEGARGDGGRRNAQDQLEEEGVDLSSHDGGRLDMFLCTMSMFDDGDDDDDVMNL